MNEEERLKACQDIALRMYIAGLGDNYDAIERLTRPPLDLSKFVDLRMPEPTPYQRGVLDRYQNKRHTWRRRFRK